MAIIRVGAATETELKEKKHRVEDALSATRAAVEEGIVPGGGVTFINAIKSLDNVEADNEDEETGVQILRRALEAPMHDDRGECRPGRRGRAGNVRRMQKEQNNINLGYEVISGEYKDMLKAGITDPAKVTRSAVENAASIAAMILTTAALITDIPEKEKNQPAPQMPDY